MHSEEEYQNNPLHGVGLEAVLTQLVAHYGFEILHAYLNLNCFKTNPSIASSMKFLKKTDWAKDKVEAFYMYQYKSLPRADDEQFELPPRDRIVPMHQKPGEPAQLSLEDAENLRVKRAKKSREHAAGRSGPWGENSSNQAKHRSTKFAKQGKPNSQSSSQSNDPWAMEKAANKSNKQANTHSSTRKPSNPWGK